MAAARGAAAMIGAGNGGRRRRGSGVQRIGRLAALAIVMAVAPGLPLAPGGGPAVAQQGPQSSGTTHLRRELRALELQGLAPNSDIDVYRAQRDVIRQGRGLNFTPEQRRIDRQ